MIAILGMALTAMAQSAGITLSSNGTLKFFRSDQFGDAIDAAQPNDTIYFAPGEYQINKLWEWDNWNSRKITKPLVLIGAGGHENGTRFSTSSSQSLYIDLSQYDTNNNFSMEGIRYNGGRIIVASDIDNLTFRNMYVQEFGYTVNDTVTAKVNNMLVDRCHITSEVELGNDRVASANFLNSKINNIKGSCTNNIPAANHCKLWNVDSSFTGFILNSFIRYGDVTNSSLENCGYYSVSGVSETNTKNSFNIGYDFDGYDDNPSQLDASYVSNDGTPMGTSGGDNPFSLYPSYPTPDVTKSTIEYDVNNKKLNVTIKLLGAKETETPAE